MPDNRMDPIARELLDVVRAELGYREKAGQRTKYGEWYAEHVAGGDPQFTTGAWCDMFIAWAAHKAGVSEYVGTFAWTPSHARWFQRHQAWSDRPEPGALVFFDWSGSKKISKIDHVGIVERVEGDRIHTIEGNVDKVWLKRKVRDESKVVGYGLPRKVKEYLDQTRISWPERVVDLGRRGEPGVTPFGAPIETLTVVALLVAVAGTVLVAARTRLRRTAGRPAPARGRHRRTARPQERPAPPVTAGAPAVPPDPYRDADALLDELTRTR